MRCRAPHERRPHGHRKEARNRKISMLLFLILFVSFIILVSVALSGIASYILFHVGFIPNLAYDRFPIIIVCILLISLVIGALLSSVMGSYSLRPLRHMIDATKEISAGNFNVTVAPNGPDEFKRLAVSFNEMAKELSGIETLRSDFVSNISHEFKTPVVSIRGFAKLLKKESLSDEQRQEYLDIIISESERLTQLSSNILLLSNLESTDRIVEKNTFDLDEQIRRSVLLLEPQLQRKRLELNIEFSPTRITTNEEMLQHVWINLLGNAIKFSAEGGTIELSLHTTATEILVVVADTGIGMDQETCRHVFDKFYQGERSRSTEGNGLGLSLVKRILDLTGGRISVESTLGAGTRFTVAFPCHPAGDCFPASNMATK